MTDIEAKRRALATRREAEHKRLLDFCDRFVREHHPDIASENSLKPISAPGLIHDIDSNWWFNTNASMMELGVQYVGYLFDRKGMRDHEWAIGRSQQEPWALVSEPYNHIKPETIEQLRVELEEIGVKLIQYPTEQSTYAPGYTLLLVANVVGIYSLMGAVARHIAAYCSDGLDR